MSDMPPFKKKRDMRKYTCTCSLVQQTHMKDKLETTEIAERNRRKWSGKLGGMGTRQQGLGGEAFKIITS